MEDRVAFICLDCGQENRYTVEQLIARTRLRCLHCKSTNVERENSCNRQMAKSRPNQSGKKQEFLL